MPHGIFSQQWRLLLFTLLAFACSDVKDPHDHDHDHEHEVMTRVVLTLADTHGHGSQDFTWEDPNGDGNSTVEDIVLRDGETYEVQITIWNDLSDPSEEVTPEIIDEADEHQIFITAPDFIEYSILDADSSGLDLGLEQEWVASIGSGTITIGLRHMPEEDGVSVKTEDMDLDNLPGAWDFNIDFPITVE